MRFANWFAVAWRFADQLRSASWKLWSVCNSRKLTRRCSHSKRKVLCCAANFIPMPPSKNGVIADCWREFIGSRSIDCARKFSRSRFTISIVFFLRGSEPTRNIGSKVWKACNPSWNSLTVASCHWLRGNRRCFRRVWPITIPNGWTGSVFPVGLAGDV